MPVSVPICEHVKPGGGRCGSPALRGRNFCYYHTRLYESLPVGRNMYAEEKKNAAPGEWPIYEFPVPALEDAAAIQIGFMQALHGVANHNLDPRRAKLVLSALHGARMNLKQMEACLLACAQGASGKRAKKPPASVKNARTKQSSAAPGKRME